MRYLGIEYSIHHGPRGWGWKLYSGEEQQKYLKRVGLADTRLNAIALAKLAIEQVVSQDANAFQSFSLEEKSALRN